MRAYEFRVASLLGSSDAWVRVTNKSSHLSVELISGQYFNKDEVMASIANKQRDTYDFSACSHTWGDDKVKARMDADINHLEWQLAELKFCRKAVSRKTIEFTDAREQSK